MSFAAYHRQCVGHYLKQNKLLNEPIGKLGNILEDITQRAYESYEAQTKARKKKGDATEEEIAIYEAYPRKIARGDALKAIGEACQKANGDVLLAATKRYASCVARWPAGYRFHEGRDLVPYPASWFRAGRWEDAEKEWLPAGMFLRPDDPTTEQNGTSRHPRPTLLEPEGWHEEFPTSVFKTWEEVPQDSRRAICDHMNKVKA